MLQKTSRIVLVSIFAVLSLLLGGHTTFAQGRTPPPPKRYSSKSETSPLSPDFHTTLPEKTDTNAPTVNPEETAWIGIIVDAFILNQGNWDIFYAKNLSTSTFSNETNNPARDMYPQLNRDATKFVFVSDRDGNDEIYVKDMETGILQRLTVNSGQDTTPLWSPDDTQIAFTSDRDGDDEIFIMNADGSGVRQVTHNSIADFSPTWSPDGTQLAWIQVWDSQSGVIYIMNQDGSNPHPLSSPLRYVNHLSWSPDGASLYFDYDSNGDGWQDLGYMTIDNARLYTIATANPETDLLASGWYPYPYTPGNGVSTEVVASQVNYILYQGQWYIESMSAHMRYIGSAYPDMALARKFNYPLYPHLRPRDLYAPFSVINPLPKYSRIPFIPFSVYAYDVGKSGLNTVNVEYTLGTSGSWNSVQPNYSFFDPTSPVLGSGNIFMLSAGQTLFVRSNATDNAGNTEALPDVPDASTMLYQTLVSGTVRDIRDTPVSEARLSISPAPAGMEIGDGWYHAYLPDAGEYAVTVGAQGYLSASMKMASPVDVQQDGVIHPADNLIQGGDFSTTTLNSAWVVSGTATVYSDTAYSGVGSLHLGTVCQNPSCLQGAGTLISSMVSYRLMDSIGYVFDSDQNLHLINNWGTYAMRSPDGQWSMSSVWPDSNWVSDIPIAVGPGNTVYVLRSGAHPTLYTHSLGDSAWYSDTLPSGWGSTSSLAVDSVSGDVYASIGMTLFHRDSTGNWTNIGSIYGNDMTLVSAHDGGVDAVVYTKDSLDIMYIHADGTSDLLATYPYTDSAVYYFSSLQAVQSSSGRIHILAGGVYFSWSPDDGWHHPVYLDKSSYPWMVPLLGNEVAFVSQQAGIASSFDILFYDPVSGASQKRHLQDISTHFSSFGVFISPDKTIYALGNFASYELRALPTLTTTEQTSVSQAVTIPAGMPNPTLSFMYALQSVSPSQNSAFQVAVTDAAGQHTLMSTNTTTAGAWQHAWFDMSSWAGQSITVTFALSQPVGDRAMNLYLDDIYLGAWTTPVISDITPIQLDAWDGASIVITGTNFTTPTVQLGNYTLTVMSVTPNQIIAQLPAGIPAGAYPLRVQNADGQVAVSKKDVVLGHLIYLPLTQR